MRFSGPACGPDGGQLWLALDAFAERGGEPSWLLWLVCRRRRRVVGKEALKCRDDSRGLALGGCRAADFDLGWSLKHQA